MVQTTPEYSQAWADAEKRLAASSLRPGVKAVHERFAAAYRAAALAAAVLPAHGNDVMVEHDRFDVVVHRSGE